ncbi:MAG TPA: preprotein translocase subunit SecE [Anaerolineales bacterium]|nr:preprotein translocase subunit SecE [Anaerolineales bacterium]
MADKQVVRRQPNALQRLYRETVGELRKVSWPTRREAANLTIIVLVVIIAMTVILGSLDVFLSWLLSLMVGA